jgi:hypothetical protein
METYTFYKIQCKDASVTEIYIGSTKNFKFRKRDHKSACDNSESKDYNLKVYIYIRDHNGWTNFNMNVIETGEYESKIEAHMRENELIEIHKSNLNMIRAYRTEEQKKEQNLKDNKKYHQSNKEKKEKYYQDNKEKLKKQTKKYRDDNKDIIRKRKNEKIECECGSKHNYGAKSRHIKTIKHQTFIQTNNQNLEIK